MNISRTIHSQCDDANVFSLGKCKMSLFFVNNHCENVGSSERGSGEETGRRPVFGRLQFHALRVVSAEGLNSNPGMHLRR